MRLRGAGDFTGQLQSQELSENLLGPMVHTELGGVGFKDEQQQPLSQET